MLKQQIQTDLATAQKEKNTPAVNTLRMLFSTIRYFEIEKGKEYEATDEEIATIIQKEVKKRKESIDMYKKGNRDDLVQKEQDELASLEKYLPEQMSEDEVRKKVQEAIQQTGASSMQDMGKVMGAVMSKVKGKADGGLVGKIVKEELS